LALLADPPFNLKVRLGVALSGICVRAGEPDRAIELIEEIRLAGTLDRSAAAWLALIEGQAQLLRREGQAATKAFEQALGLMRATGDRRGEGLTLAELAHVVGVRGGRISEAKPLLDRALLLLRAQGDFAGEALAESYRGALCCIVGDFGAGRAAYERSRIRALEARDRRTSGIATGMLAGVCCVAGEVDASLDYFEDALRTQRSIGDRVHEAIHCSNFAELLAQLGRNEEAIAHLSRAAEIAALSGDAMTEGVALGNRGVLRALLRDQLGARADMERGEQRLRAAGDPAELGKHLCRSATLWLQCGEPERARTALAEVEAIVSQIPVTAASEVSVALAELRRALAQT
jgi:tetratricopeptide (TPR) repeat protein